MNKQLPIIALILVATISSGKEEIGITGECIYELIEIAPKSSDLSQNPIILVDYRERDYRIFEELKSAEFCIVDNRGRKTKLEILEIKKAFHSTAQILLKSKRKLKKGRTVHIEIHGLDLKNEKAKRFADRVKSKKWKVSFKVDKTAPSFKSEIKSKYENYLNSSASFHGINGNISFYDNYEYTYETKKADEKEMKLENQIILEITNTNGKSILIPTYGSSFWLIDGMCGASFELKQDTEYTFEVRLIDMSGNKSKEVKQIQFKTGNTNWN